MPLRRGQRSNNAPIVLQLIGTVSIAGVSSLQSWLCTCAFGLFSRFDLVGRCRYFCTPDYAPLTYLGTAGVGMAYAAMAEEEQKQQGSNPAVAHSVVEKPNKRSGRGFAAGNQ